MIKICLLCIIYKLFPTVTIFGSKCKNGSLWKICQKLSRAIFVDFRRCERTMLYTYILFDKKSQIPTVKISINFPTPPPHIPYYIKRKEEKRK